MCEKNCSHSGGLGSIKFVGKVVLIGESPLHAGIDVVEIRLEVFGTDIACYIFAKVFRVGIIIGD
jgi:hypothetical protein